MLQFRTLRIVKLALIASVLAASAMHSVARAQTHPLPRIVALVPSLVDDCVGVGAQAQIVGVSKFAEAPAQIPRVGDFRTIDAERIVALHPDVVLAIASQARLVEPLKRAGIHVAFVSDDTYDDIFRNIVTVGDLSGHAAAARALVARLRAQTAQLHAQTRAFRHHPAVFVALGTGPIWTAGPSSYMGHLLELAGARDAATLAQPWGQYSEEALLRAQPDAVLSDNETDMKAAVMREPWRSLRAVRERHLLIITDPHIINALFRPGPRYNEGLRWLIERLTPLAT